VKSHHQTDRLSTGGQDTSWPAEEWAAQRSQRVDMTSGPVMARLLKLTWPLVTGNLLQTFYNLADMFWVGRVGADAVAAVSIVFPTAWLLISIGMGLTVAAGVFVAQHIGARQEAAARHVAGQAVTAALVLGMALAALGYALRVPLLRLMGAEGAVFSHALQYVEVIFWSVPFSFLFFAFRSVLRGCGDTFTAMIMMVLSTLANIILDPLLILGWGPIPAMGTRGAAVATLLARAGVALFGAYLLFRGSRGLRLRPADLYPNTRTIRRLIIVGAPAALDGAARSFSAVATIALVTRFGPAVTAAYGVSIRLMSTIWTVSGAVGEATNTAVGQNLGAGKPDRAERIAWIATAWDFLFLSLVGLLAFLFPEPIIRVFVQDPAVIQEGRILLRIVVWGFGFAGALMVIQGAFRGAGRTVAAMLLSFVSRWLVRLPAIYLLAYTLDWGPLGLWWGMLFADVVSALAGALWLRMGTWKSAIIEIEGAAAQATRPTDGVAATRN